jgi:CDGSH-type Zn-finger protein/uncharacterized Fe-S cluster protein YjdI
MKERIVKYKGKDIIVYFNVDRCTHVAECLRGLPRVFDIGRNPWVMPDLAEPGKIAEVIMRCPTGALHFKRSDDGPEETVPEENIITAACHGPLYLKGNIEILDSEESVLLKDTRVALCRCGRSRNKPLCDGSHDFTGFRDAGGIKRRGSEESLVVPDILKVTVDPGGPLILNGPMVIKNGDNKVGFRGDRAILCSCGLSHNKPFCDGSHSQ